MDTDAPHFAGRRSLRPLAVALIAACLSLTDFGESSRAARAAAVTPQQTLRDAKGALSRDPERARLAAPTLAEPKTRTSPAGRRPGYQFRTPARRRSASASAA